MSSPNSMQTGRSLNGLPENYFTEIYFIVYLILSAILRRNGLKDCVLYASHNNLEFSQDIYDSGVLFNLMSEYGVGNGLKPLIIELFQTVTLIPDDKEDNIFFDEIVRLTPEVSRVVRTHDATEENLWIYKYSLKMLSVKDSISHERMYRLRDLIDVIPELNNNSDYLCQCKFCEEFRKYHTVDPSRNVSKIINKLLISIATDQIK
jgi:hypothetical protein